MDAIKTNNLTKHYSGYSLEGLNLTLPKGTIMGLVGENGAGKTTTIKLLLGAITADAGSACVLGIDTSDKSFIDTKQDIGVVLDEAHFPDVLTAEKIETIMKYTYINWDSELFYSYTDKLNLPINKPLADFSRGMKMKFSLAVALSHKAKLLILDEPTSGLDPFVRESILDILNEFTRDEENSILISSHIVSDLEKICDYIAFIQQGKLTICEEKDILLEKYAIVKLSEKQALQVANDTYIRKMKTHFGYTLLMEKSKVPVEVTPEISSLEDIILLLSRKN